MSHNKYNFEEPIFASTPSIGISEIIKLPNSFSNKWFDNYLVSSLIGKSFYFVHSFVCITKDHDSTIAVCNYSDISIPAVVATGNVFGCQFHPEKSADNGLDVLKNFFEI